MSNDKNKIVHKDDKGKVRQLAHPYNHYQSGQRSLPTVRSLADEYIEKAAADYEIDSSLLSGLSSPSDTKNQIQFLNDKKIQNTHIVTYQQVYKGRPVCNSNIDVRINVKLNSVVGSVSAHHYDIDLPWGEEKVDHPEFKSDQLPGILGIEDDLANGTQLTINRTRDMIYCYEAAERVHVDEDMSEELILSLSPVDDQIKDGVHYPVTEVKFTLTNSNKAQQHWTALIESRTGTALYVHPHVAHLSGSFFSYDPQTQGRPYGPGTIKKDLNKARTIAPLEGLVTPAAGEEQELKGEYVVLQELSLPAIGLPTKPLGEDFIFDATTDDFSAVNAYRSCDFFFRYLDSLGIDLDEYFPNTTFPVPVDPRGKGGARNASCEGNALGNGIGSLLFGLAAQGHPVGISASLRVVMHEFGHGVLYDHVGGPNLGFAHSAGDAFAVIFHDPYSFAPDRSLSFPFVGGNRRHDRKVEDGWAWFGTKLIEKRDANGNPIFNTQYQAEQVLSTTLFRAYLATGGDSDFTVDKVFASQYMFYLIVKACGLMTGTTSDPKVFVTALEQADMNTDDFWGTTGGTNHKVIRWAFEKQGLFQADDTEKPYTTAGLPPPVDVYINDGRDGEYEYTSDYQSTTDIWNRVNEDDGFNHQDPKSGQSNYAYVRIKNRGTETADDITVRAFRHKASSGDNYDWPGDWEEMTTPEIALTNELASEGETIVGPFEWIPSKTDNNSILMIVSAPGDQAIIDNPNITGQTVENWRLVPLDNNIAQRNMDLARTLF